MFAFRRAASHDGEWGGNETRTLFLAVMGGWPGAKLGRMLFRPERESQGFGLILDASVFALPVVVSLPFLLRAVPGWIPHSASQQPTPIVDATAGKEAAGQSATSVGDSTGTSAPTGLAAVPAPARPADLAVAVASEAPASTSSTLTPSGSTASSSGSNSTNSTSTASATTTPTAPTTTNATTTAQSPRASTSSGPTLRQRVLRARRLLRK